MKHIITVVVFVTIFTFIMTFFSDEQGDQLVFDEKNFDQAGDAIVKFFTDTIVIDLDEPNEKED